MKGSMGPNEEVGFTIEVGEEVGFTNDRLKNVRWQVVDKHEGTLVSHT